MSEAQGRRAKQACYDEDDVAGAGADGIEICPARGRVLYWPWQYVRCTKRLTEPRDEMHCTRTKAS